MPIRIGRLNLKSCHDLQDFDAVYTGVIFGLITLVIIYIFTRKRARGNTLLICGPCESGKTCLFGQLLHKKSVETYTSAKENTGT